MPRPSCGHFQAVGNRIPSKGRGRLRGYGRTSAVEAPLLFSIAQYQTNSIIPINLNKSTNFQLKAIALYQIIGGVLGIALTLWVMFSGEMVVALPALRIGLFAGGLYVFSILCGSMLFRKPQRALVLSLINQVLQVVYFSFGAYGFQYVAGLRIGIGVDMVGGWIFKFRMALSSFHFSVGDDLGQKFIGVNLVALFLIFWLERLLEETKKQV